MGIGTNVSQEIRLLEKQPEQYSSTASTRQYLNMANCLSSLCLQFILWMLWY